MWNYNFPINIEIEEAREIVRQNDEFVEKTTSDYIVFNYNVSFADTFPEVRTRQDAIRREMRGLIFYPDGRIASRRFHKFFNMNEREETLIENIDWNSDHVFMDKLDGSMISAFIYPDASIGWFSKMGETFVSVQVQRWLEQDSKRKETYENFVRYSFKSGKTAIFEWCSPANRIVVRHDQSNLVLIAIRDNDTGSYMSGSGLKYIAETYGIPCVSFTNKNIIDQNATDVEGWVVRFDNGHMVKVKTQWYLDLHKTKSYLEQEKDVVKLILDEKVDDLLSILESDGRKRIEDYSKALHSKIHMTVTEVEELIKVLKSNGIDRKTFALEWMKKTPELYGQIVFGSYGEGGLDFDADMTFNRITDFLKKNTSSGTKLEKAKKSLAGPELVYGQDKLED